MLPVPHDGEHGQRLGHAPHVQQLPGVHIRDVVHHHIAGGEAETGHDSTAVAKVYKRLRGIVWERPGVSRISVRI